METILSALFIGIGFIFGIVCLLAWTSKVEDEWDQDV